MNKPLDAQLGLSADRISAVLRALVRLSSACLPFAEACVLLAKATGVQRGTKRAQLVSEGWGVRLEQVQAQVVSLLANRCAVPPPRLYLGIDGILSCTTEKDEHDKLAWREAKVGVFYAPLPEGAPGTGRRSHLVDTGAQVDVADSTIHAHGVPIGEWHGLAAKVWQEAQRQGVERVRELVLLSDGGDWIVSVRQEVLDGLPLRVTHILDHRHAEEHLWAVARACLGDQAAAWLPRPLDALSHGRIDALLAVARALPTATAETAKLVATTCTYYDDCRAMLDYPRFRAQGYQIGSGLAESACKRLVSQREKGPGMHWTVGGAQAIATLRAAYSDRWQERSRPWPLPNGTRPLLHAHIIGGQAASLVADDSSERWVTTEAVPAVEQFFRLGTGLATQMYALHTDEDGASIAIDPWDFEGSEYERARLNSTADWGAKFCEPQQGPIVDVGSCEGVLVGRLLDRGFKIVACEPNPRFRQRLLSTPASNAVRHGLVCTSDLAGA